MANIQLSGEKVINYINGEWTSSKKAKFVTIVNPADGQPIGEVLQSSKEDVDLAVQAAKQAQKNGHVYRLRNERNICIGLASC